MEHLVIPYIAAMLVNPVPGSKYCKFQKGKTEEMGWKAYCEACGVPSDGWGYTHFQRLRRNVFGSTRTPPPEEVPQKGLEVLCFERILGDWRYLTPELKKELLDRIMPTSPSPVFVGVAELSDMDNLVSRMHILETGLDRIWKMIAEMQPRVDKLIGLEAMTREFHTDYFRIGPLKTEEKKDEKHAGSPGPSEAPVPST
jgi:hypothetical protein